MADDPLAVETTRSPQLGDDTEAVTGRIPLVVWVLPALLALAACLLGTVHPVLWQDELATVSAAQRSVPDLLRLLVHRDAVHGLYYLVVHGWTSVFGMSPVTVRLPAAFAAAAWAALVGVLGCRLFGPRVGLLGGLLLAVLPAVSLYGAEARPYTFAAAAVTACTLTFVQALRRPGRRIWAWYAASIVLTGYLQITAVTVIGAHALAVAWIWHQDRQQNHRLPVRWAVAAGAALLPLLPLLLLSIRQSHELGTVPGPTWRSVIGLPTGVFVSAVAGALLIGMAWPALCRRELRGLLLGAVALLPPAVIVLVSFHTSLMRPRYLLFTVLAWALLAAATLAPLGWRVWLAALLAVALAGLPSQLDQAGTTRNNQPDYRAMAQLMAPLTRPGDVMVLPDGHGLRFRIGIDVYLPARHRPRDVLATASPAQAAALDSPVCDASVCLGTPARIWVGCYGLCRDPLTSITAGQRQVITQRGYRPAHSWQVAGGAITLFTRMG